MDKQKIEDFDMRAPWIVWARKLDALFARDDDVTVVYENDGPIVKVYVRGADKAESMSELLPCEMTFDDVSVPVEVIPANDGELTVVDHLRRVFAGNPAFVDVITESIVPGGPSMTFALFAPAVVQIECDNIGSPWGLMTTTYENIAKDVLTADGVMLTSDLAED